MDEIYDELDQLRKEINSHPEDTPPQADRDGLALGALFAALMVALAAVVMLAR